MNPRNPIPGRWELDRIAGELTRWNAPTAMPADWGDHGYEVTTNTASVTPDSMYRWTCSCGKAGNYELNTPELPAVLYARWLNHAKRGGVT